VILYRARWVFPVSSPPIEHGAVGVADGRIAYVGPGDDAPHGERFELGDAALVPGLVNTHSHLDLTVMRGLLAGLPFFSWIRALTAARREVLSESDLLDSARVGLREGLLAGITVYGDTSPSPGAFEAMAELGVRGVAFREIFGPDPRQCRASMQELQQGVDSMRARTTDLVRVGVSPHAPFSVSDDLFRASAAFARAERLPVATHVAESEDESLLVERGTGPFADFLRSRGIEVERRARSPIALLERCGVLDADPLLIHCVRADADDIALIGRRRLAVAHCPASNRMLGHGVAPVAALIAAGARVGFGSDSMASNDRMDLLGEAREALRSQGDRDHGLRGADEALELSTLGGARALGLEREIGSLEVGKEADMAAFTISTPIRSQAPAEALLSLPPGTRAAIVMVAGRPLVRSGRIVATGDGAEDRVEAAAARLRAWRATVIASRAT
jgi:5-methylthioadenosine/S-adenosylhomocysteine deaminase